jgi:exodeoxyribonuclease V gamma subunit
MHSHAHPLLAAWGRQGRDFMRLLDAFDDAERTRQRFDIPRVDLFDDGTGATMLEQVQASIRDLVPLAEHPPRVLEAADRSIVFHVAHSAQREVEILHDQLLDMLRSPSLDSPLKPRDIVVMVPDIDTFAPAIRAVFGAYRRDDARFIPFEIADLKNRGSNMLMVAIEWLLRLPVQRFRLAEVRDLLDVPAIASRFGLDAEGLPRLAGWMAGAGIRWGLDAEQRAQLGLTACGEQNTCLFGLRRMLLGYASDGQAAFADIQPYDEIGGLEASLVGVLADAIDRLTAWWRVASTEATPHEWAVLAHTLLDALVAPTDEAERLTVAALQRALSAWLDACDAAGFEQRVPLSVLREAWLSGVDSPTAGRRFLAGGVTFCTLMPLRAVPFEVVCLLGMNDGDYPRQSRRSDLDLMALPGQQRPGDRSRRDDDRYLMLEALLSARRVLYISWCGRSARDNTAQPPSVLVSQLRDYLAAVWTSQAPGGVLGERTTEHPLQPFSRRYFEGRDLFTFAREWRAAHRIQGEAEDTHAMPPFEATGAALTVEALARFLRNPVKEFFKVRLDVVFHDDDTAPDDDEPFGLDGLTEYGLLSELLANPDTMTDQGTEQAVSKRIQGFKRAGRLPLGEMGVHVAGEMEETALQMLSRWRQVQSRYADAAPRQRLHFEHEGLLVDDWLDGLKTDGTKRAWIELSASRLLDKKGRLRADKLITGCVRMLVSSACAECTAGVMVGRDATLTLSPLDTSVAGRALRKLMTAWRDGMQAPLPLAPRTALAWVTKERTAELIYEGGFDGSHGEGQEPCLSRRFPDFDALVADGRFERYATLVFAPMRQWVESSVAIARDGNAPSDSVTEAGDE